MKYFNVTIREKPDGMSLTRDNYITVNKNSSFRKGIVYTDDFCKQHTIDCLYNFDKNINFFNSLSNEQFEKELEDFLDHYPEFKEIKDLNLVNKKEGYYLLVLRKYKQVYIGTSKDIKQRIMSHWSKTKEFDRLIFGRKDNSKLSIDSFRAFDTTEIFVATGSKFTLEDEYVQYFDDNYLINRTAGGKLEKGLQEAVSKGKIRDLNLKQEPYKNNNKHKLSSDDSLEQRQSETVQKDNTEELNFKRISFSRKLMNKIRNYFKI